MGSCQFFSHRKARKDFFLMLWRKRAKNGLLVTGDWGENRGLLVFFLQKLYCCKSTKRAFFRVQKSAFLGVVTMCSSIKYIYRFCSPFAHLLLTFWVGPTSGRYNAGEKPS